MTLQYNELVTFDADEFAAAFRWAMQAAAEAAHIQNPERLAITIPVSNGAQATYHVVDQPTTRIMLALVERYGRTDSLKYHSLLARIFALLDLVRDGGLDPWACSAEGLEGWTEIAPAMIEAAASMPLNERMQFRVREFMRLVRQIEAAGEQARGAAFKSLPDRRSGNVIRTGG